MNQKAFVMAWLSFVREAVQAHIHEAGGNNLGQQIEKYQEACGGEPGEAWCMYFQIFYALKVYAGQVRRLQITPASVVSVLQGQRDALRAAYGLLVTGSCGEQMRYQQSKSRLVFRDEIKEIKPGWLIFYAWTAADIQNQTPRHVGMCDVEWNRTSHAALPPIFSLEGNTSGATGDPSEGDGCFRKERAFANVVAVARTY